MSERWPQFDIKHDIEVVNAGDFWCHACLVDKPAAEASPDPRYCQGCYEFLSDEAEQLSSKRGCPDWLPTPARERHQMPPVSPPPSEELVTKIAPEGITPEGIMLQGNGRGRPRKQAGEPVTRMTEWRRKREVEATANDLQE